jgi:uncharacterized protein
VKSPKKASGSSNRGDAFLWVRVKPRAFRNRITGWSADGFLEVQLTAIPEKGEANRACIVEIARALGIAREQVVLETGQTARRKKFRVHGVSDDDLRSRLGKVQTVAKDT